MESLIGIFKTIFNTCTYGLKARLEDEDKILLWHDGHQSDYVQFKLYFNEDLWTQKNKNMVKPVACLLQ